MAQMTVAKVRSWPSSGPGRGARSDPDPAGDDPRPPQRLPDRAGRARRARRALRRDRRGPAHRPHRQRGQPAPVRSPSRRSGSTASLSDADATAAAAFLSSAAEPPQLRQRYQADIADASAALAAASAPGDRHLGRGPVARISAALPVYTGLVETARTQNRLNLPVGAAYLREASALMRDELLPAATELYRSETAQLDRDLSAGSAFPWLTVPLILACWPVWWWRSAT